jgi:hypothetical protein
MAGAVKDLRCDWFVRRLGAGFSYSFFFEVWYSGGIGLPYRLVIVWRYLYYIRFESER